jgi:predicted DNA-binding WGR domain protein
VVYLESKDGKKYYIISDAQPDMFNEFVVSIKYGSKNYPGHTIFRYFKDKKTLEKYCQKLLDLRFKHGYHIIEK